LALAPGAVGVVGFLITAVGLCGALLAGAALDAWPQHRVGLAGLAACALASCLGLAAAVRATSLRGAYAAACSLGFFLTVAAGYNVHLE
jgi:hypothetical protein